MEQREVFTSVCDANDIDNAPNPLSCETLEQIGFVVNAMKKSKSNAISHRYAEIESTGIKSKLPVIRFSVSCALEFMDARNIP